MKNYLLYLLIVLYGASCKNSEEDESLIAENAKQANSKDLVVGIGKISPENDIIQLSSSVNGIVKLILKKENDSVAIGEVVLELDHALEDEKVNKSMIEIHSLKAQLRADFASIEEYTVKVKYAKVELKRLKNLLLKGSETQQTVDNASSNLQSLNTSLDKFIAVVNFDKSKLNESESTLQSFKIERDQKIIKSPVNGRLLEITSLIGGIVSIQQSFAQIEPEGKTIAICEIDELNATKIKVGQFGWIRNVGFSGTLSSGKIVFISSYLSKKSLFIEQSGEKEDRRVLKIKMKLDSPGKLLLNSRIECVIDPSSNIIK